MWLEIEPWKHLHQLGYEQLPLSAKYAMIMATSRKIVRKETPSSEQ